MYEKVKHLMEAMIKKSSLRKNCTVVYSQLVDTLEDSIREGSLAPGEQIPPENLLAERFQISRSSVRSGLQLLEKKGIVVKQAGKGTFVSDGLQAKNKTGDKIYTIGINLIQLENSGENWYDSKIVASILSLCGSRNLRLSIIDERQPQLLDRKFIDSLILLYYNGSENKIRALQTQGIETLLFNRIFTHDKIPYTSVNYRLESRKAVEFLRRRGHEKIGIITIDDSPSGQNRNREAGYLDAFGFNAIPSDVSTSVPPLQNSEFYTGKIRDFLKEKQKNFTALFIQNGSLAGPTFQACLDLDIRVPDEIEMLCFDDIGYLYKQYQLPFLYAKMPLSEMVKDAVNYLYARMSEPKAQLPVLKRLYQIQIQEQKQNTPEDMI